MPEILTPSGFLARSRTIPVIDVRSESEFAQGHIPGAYNIPLFNDEERAIVGTLYKNSGREASVLRGLELCGPKLSGFVKQLHAITPGKQVLVHCWRGGMRSNAMAWLFEMAGYEVALLEGGYKTFRHHIRDLFSFPLKIIIIGGKTGSGKTEILNKLLERGEQVLDLEALAHHKGSAFGGREDGYQPTNEQFYNDIFAILSRLDLSKVIWIEDESRSIGKVAIPDELFLQMTRARMIRIGDSRENRIRRLVDDYASLPVSFLNSCLERIAEKLGGTRLKLAREALFSGNYSEVAALTLDYYDKAYEHSISFRDPAKITPLETTKEDEILINQMLHLKKEIENVTDLF